MEIIEFFRTKLMHILNRESFHPPKIKQNLAVIHYGNFFWKLQVNFRDTYTFQLIKTQSNYNYFYCIVPVLVTNEWICEVIGSHWKSPNQKPNHLI